MNGGTVELQRSHSQTHQPETRTPNPNPTHFFEAFATGL